MSTKQVFDGEDHVRGLQYDSGDRLCLDGQRLLHNSGTHLRGGATYIKSVDDQSIITAHGGSSSSGPEYFTVENKAGETHYYGEVSGLYLQNIHGNVIQDTSDAFVEPIAAMLMAVLQKVMQ
ncbi:hypothetical protein [Psychrosphaera algicola]|uniref:Uncharacterized protein n=1 Tax=Psychrosphaera algicola TaxID=3023714 RepID=A0ABT5FFM3_9GAMM|nr:hypothetical protein [Psychrosphaera sp. G1-22]MDC2890350.1 hypothetical protein [Psychrosphaera sp. G1-22]